jgi:hypothetical protein
MHLHRRRLAVSCALLIGAAACGGDPDPNATTSTTAPGSESNAVTTGASAEPTGGASESDASATDGSDGSTTGSMPTTGDSMVSGVTTGEPTGEPTTSDDTTMGVDTTGDDSTSTGGDDPWDCANGEPVTVNQRGKYATLAAAVAAAPPGATITVCPGTYQETVIVDRPLTLLGAGQDKTFLDGGGVGTPLLIKQVDVTISGFTFQNGEAEHNVLGNGVCGGALAIRYSADPMIVAVTDCTFTDNHGQYGGAICYDGSNNTDTSKLVLDGVTITNNSADVNGGGIFSYSPTTMTDTTIVENTAGGQGGGMYFSYCDSTITGGTVKRNTADEGGGMFLQSPVTVDVKDSDWGFGQDQENVPNDVQHFANEYGFFGADVSFFCEYIVWNDGMCALK